MYKASQCCAGEGGSQKISESLTRFVIPKNSEPKPYLELWI